MIYFLIGGGYIAGFAINAAIAAAKIKLRTLNGRLQEETTDYSEALFWAVLQSFFWPVSLLVHAGFSIGRSFTDRAIKKIEEQNQIDALTKDIITRRI